MITARPIARDRIVPIRSSSDFFAMAEMSSTSVVCARRPATSISEPTITKGSWMYCGNATVIAFALSPAVMAFFTCAFSSSLPVVCTAIRASFQATCTDSDVLRGATPA